VEPSCPDICGFGGNDAGAALRIKAAGLGPSHGGRLVILYEFFALGFRVATSPWPYIETGITALFTELARRSCDIFTICVIKIRKRSRQYRCLTGRSIYYKQRTVYAVFLV
jgi:hypothetical protein